MQAKGIAAVVLVACACVCAWALAGQVSAPEKAPARAEAAGLQVSIRPEKASFVAGEKMTFHTEFKNAGEADLILNLGLMLANGKKQYPSALILVLTDSAGNERKLQLMGPPGIAGRMDDLVVPLPAKAAFILETSLGDYCCAESKEWRIAPAAGEYTIVARYEGKAPQYINNTGMEGVRLMPVLTGDVTSEPAAFSVSAD